MSGGEVYFWILAMGMCVSLSCAPLGCFLVLRRMSLLGDAVSHAVLPGIALAFILSGSRSSLIMTAGAALAGFLATAMIEWVHRNSPIKQDAAMGIVFTALFALGVVLITVYADKVDLDQECVLYGEITFVALQQRIFGVPEPVFRMFLVMVGVIGLIASFYKELVVTSFDAGLAQSLGISPARVHYILMGTLAVTIVSAFEAVGAILVVAMLILPGATAYLLTDRLPVMLWLSGLMAALSTCLGVAVAVGLDCSTAGSMVVAGALLFVTAFLLSPSHGCIPRMLRLRRLRLKTARENMLALILKDGSQTRRTLDPQVLRWLLDHGLVAEVEDKIQLAAKGRPVAEGIVRAHRLWETYMAEVMDISPDHLHESAHEVEHFLPPDLVDRLDQRLGRPQRDPHGADIPRDQEPNV